MSLLSTGPQGALVAVVVIDGTGVLATARARVATQHRAADRARGS